MPLGSSENISGIRCWLNALFGLAAAAAIGVAFNTDSPAGTPVAASTDSTPTFDPGRYAIDALDMMEFAGFYVDPVTWPTRRAEAELSVRNAPDTAATYPALSAALAVAGGEHSSWLLPVNPRITTTVVTDWAFLKIYSALSRHDV